MLEPLILTGALPHPPAELLLRGSSLTDYGPKNHSPNVLTNLPTADVLSPFSNGSLKFSGKRIVYASNDILLPGQSEFSFQCFVYLLNYGTGGQAGLSFLFQSNNGSNDTGVGYWINYGKINLTINGQIYAISESAMSLNAWHYIAVGRKNNTAANQSIFFSYIDNLKQSTTLALALSYSWSNSLSFCIGDRPAGAVSGQYPLNGYISGLKYTIGKVADNYPMPTSAL